VPGVPAAPDVPLPPAPEEPVTGSLPVAPPGSVVLWVSAVPPQCHVLASKRSEMGAPQGPPILAKVMSLGASWEQAPCLRLGHARCSMCRCMNPAILFTAMALAAGCSGTAPLGDVQATHREDAGSDARMEGDLVWPDSFTFLILDASSDDARDVSAKPVAKECAPFPDFGCLTDENNCEVGTPLRPVCVDGQYECAIGQPNETCGPRFPCGNRWCFAPGQYCRHIVPEGGSGDDYTCVPMPSSCKTNQIDCACLQLEACGTSCELTAFGGVTLTCP